MAPQTLTVGPGRRAARKPMFDVHPQTGASIEVFYADRTIETFGRCGAGWFWWSRRPGFAPDSPAIGPFATSYAAYRHAMNAATCSPSPRAARQRPTHNVNTDTARTRRFLGGALHRLSI